MKGLGVGKSITFGFKIIDGLHVRAFNLQDEPKNAHEIEHIVSHLQAIFGRSSITKSST